MDATIINLTEFKVQTPDQKLKTFFSLYNAEAVKEGLFEAFRWYSLNKDTSIKHPEAQERELIALFDQLIFLAEAIEDLRIDGKAGVCFICGRTGKEPLSRP
ncbi:hypothetical protein [Mucilaginibacter ginsenosidivorax]|uniref:Uncharacterized protein n=1 Tax=Mucilaginibacter ginsenosidivorax TaxID=862126 RepID=A0A5B8VTA1_9SPHI|nr:hypothetical protein [Mucilaginibacter ginsenosidivorax]QEC74669.1 hypothetical protein FSB76_01420 [Mucilaginibacter ginsenosidivorax]